jgi:hypothetical protein
MGLHRELIQYLETRTAVIQTKAIIIQMPLGAVKDHFRVPLQGPLHLVASGPLKHPKAEAASDFFSEL